MLWISWNKRITVLDFWWHLKAGQIIDQTGHIPRVDLFSYTAAGKPFILQNWLAEWLLYKVYQAGSLPLVMVFGGALLAVGYGLLLALTWRLTGQLRVAALITLLAEAMALRSANVRPQVFSFPLLILVYGLLWFYYQRRSRAVWLVPALMALWANLHGAFVLGLILIALMLGAVAWNIWKARLLRQLWEPVVVGLLSVIATLLNPEGVRLYEYVRTVLADPISQRLVMEWQPARPTDWYNLPFFAALFLGLLLLIYSPRRPTLMEVVLFAIFGAFGLFSIRNIMWYAIVAAPVLALQIASLPVLSGADDHTVPGTTRWGTMLARRLLASSSTGRPALNLALLLVLITLTLLFSPWMQMYLRSRGGNENALLDPNTPVKAVRFVREHNLKGHIFHPQIYGDYMIWVLYPRHKIFVDGRVHLYGPEIWSDYFLMIRGADWEELAEQYAIQHAVLDRTDSIQERLDQVLRNSPQWRLVYSDARSAIYSRVSE